MSADSDVGSLVLCIRKAGCSCCHKPQPCGPSKASLLKQQTRNSARQAQEACQQALVAAEQSRIASFFGPSGWRSEKERKRDGTASGVTLHPSLHCVTLFCNHFPKLAAVLQKKKKIAQLAGAVEYTDCTSAEGQDPHPNECPGYDTKQFDGEVPVMQQLWGMRNTPLLPSLPGLL